MPSFWPQTPHPGRSAIPKLKATYGPLNGLPPLVEAADLVTVFSVCVKSIYVLNVNITVFFTLRENIPGIWYLTNLETRKTKYKQIRRSLTYRHGPIWVQMLLWDKKIYASGTRHFLRGWRREGELPGESHHKLFKFYKLKMLPLTLLVSQQQLAFPEPPRGRRASAPLWTPATPALPPSVPSSLTSKHRLHDRHGQQDRSEQSVLMEPRVCWESNISSNERLQPWIPYQRQWSLIEMMKTISSSLHTPCSRTHMRLTGTLLPPGRSPQAAAEE